MEIYICDDSRPDLMRLAHHLKEYILNLDMHVEIRSFSSGESILAAYKRALVKPSLIFLDIYMGNMNGMDVARAFPAALSLPQVRPRTQWTVTM